MKYALAVGFIAFAAFVIVLLATRWGVATSSDSYRYIRAARHALGREAVVQSPIEAPAERAHYPPGYSTTLVLASLGGADPLAAARWVQALLMAANVLVAAELVRRASGSALAALFVAAWTAVAPANLFIHAWALSEPLFIVLMMLSLGMIAAHIATPRFKVLIVAALLCGLAILVRYLGVALIPAGAAAVLLLNRERPFRVRLRDAAIFAACAALPPALWSLRNSLVLGSATNRVIAFHPLTLAHIGDAAQVFCTWLFKSDHKAQALRAVAGVTVIAVLAAGVWLARRRGGGSILAGVVLISTAAFALTLAWSISFVDFHTPVDIRILAPVHATFLVLLGLLLATMLRRGLPVAIVACVVASLFLLNSMERSFARVRVMYRDGEGFAHEVWRNSPVVAAIREIPPDLIIYSNAPGAVYLLTGRPVIITIPAERSASNLLPNPEYAESMQRISADLRAGRAVIAYLRNYGKRRVNYPTEADLQRTLGLNVRAQLSDGTIFDAIAPAANASTTPATAPAR